MKKAKTGKWNDYPDISTTSSFTDTTGMMPTPPLTDEQFEAYLTQQFGYKKSEVAERIEYINSLGVNTKADFDAYVSSISLSPDTDEFANFAQDILDLIEYANGDSEQTYWGSLRKQNGSETDLLGDGSYRRQALLGLQYGACGAKDGRGTRT